MTEMPPATLARDLVRRASSAALAVKLADGSPYAALVLSATDQSGAPILFISSLAEHTKALAADPAACLLFDDTAGLEARLTGARVSLVGQLARVDDPLAKARFMARQPEAGVYRDFGDFSVWRMTVARVHLVAGFGRIHWIDGADYLLDTADAGELVTAEAGIVEHMNDDHLDAIGLYATSLLGEPAADWRMTGIDPEGIDLMAGAVRRRRLRFPEPVKNAMEARVALVNLVKLAREAH